MKINNFNCVLDGVNFNRKLNIINGNLKYIFLQRIVFILSLSETDGIFMSNVHPKMNKCEADTFCLDNVKYINVRKKFLINLYKL